MEENGRSWALHFFAVGLGADVLWTKLFNYFKINIHVNMGFTKMKWSFLFSFLIGVFNLSSFVYWQREAFSL